MLSSTQAGVTGPYETARDWEAILEAARKRPRLRTLVRNWERTHHAGCLNAIMDNADANLWLTYYTGRVTEPA